MNVFYRLNGINSADQGSYSLTGTTPAALTTTNYTLSTLKASSTSLEIGAVLTSGTGGARLSNVATVVTYTLPVPASPSNLTANGVNTTIGTTTLKYSDLAWTDNSTFESGFYVDKSTDGVTFTRLATLAANTVTFKDYAVTSGNTYYYRISAYNGTGTSTPSNTASALIP